jgi:hypothetical protein
LLLGDLLGDGLDGRRRSGLGESEFPPNPLGKIHRKTPQITSAEWGLSYLGVFVRPLIWEQNQYNVDEYSIMPTLT